ncbi:MAG: IPTL-CTERM sorting domain-containing protein [Chitinophagales bacterium]
MKHLYASIYPTLKPNPEPDKGGSSQQRAQSFRQNLSKIAAFATPLVAIASIPNQYTEAAVQSGTFASATLTGSNNIFVNFTALDLDGDSSADVLAGQGFFNGTAFSGFAAFIGFPGLANGYVGAASAPFFDKLNTTYNFAPTSLSSTGLVQDINSVLPFPGGGLAFHETTASGKDFGEFFTSTGSSTGYISLVTPLTSTGQLHLVWMQVEVGANVSSLKFIDYGYEDCPYLSVGTSIQIGATTGGADCGTTPPAIPTLSEWGLITLAIFLMTFGTVYIGRREEILETAGSSHKSQAQANQQFKLGAFWQRPPINWSILSKTLFGTSVLAAIAAILTYAVYGSIAMVDILGTAVAGPLFAYLTHLIWLFEAEKKEGK